MNKMNRRQFLKTSLVSTAVVGLWPRLAFQSSARSIILGANGDIRFAVVGFGGRGRDHIKEMREVKGTRLVALCDVDSTILARELKQCENLGEKVAGYGDVRQLLENKEIDVVTFATPNHW